MTRGRGVNSPAVRATSPRSQTTALTGQKIYVNAEAGLDQKQASAYGHHRQASIVNGLHHSRNMSFAQSPATSPLSPQVVAAAQTPGTDSSNTASEDSRDTMFSNSYPFTPNGASRSASSVATPTPGMNGSAVGSDGSRTNQRRPERVASTGKSKRDAPHNRSLSKNSQELKTVGEYALHHLFNSVSA